DGAGDSDPPLIPWTFWYWPTAKGNAFWDLAGDVMARFGKAFGKNPNDCKSAEQTDHVTDPVSDIPYFDWQGHCHLAAPASILFEEPRDTKHNGQSFDQADLKFLALEYWGNFGKVLPVWELARGPEIGKYYLPRYFKPGEPKNHSTLVNGLKQNPMFRGNDSLDDPELNKAMRKVA